MSPVSPPFPPPRSAEPGGGPALSLPVAAGTGNGAGRARPPSGDHAWAGDCGGALSRSPGWPREPGGARSGAARFPARSLAGHRRGDAGRHTAGRGGGCGRPPTGRARRRVPAFRQPRREAGAEAAPGGRSPSFPPAAPPGHRRFSFPKTRGVLPPAPPPPVAGGEDGTGLDVSAHRMPAAPGPSPGAATPARPGPPRHSARRRLRCRCLPRGSAGGRCPPGRWPSSSPRPLQAGDSERRRLLRNSRCWFNSSYSRFIFFFLPK